MARGPNPRPRFELSEERLRYEITPKREIYAALVEALLERGFRPKEIPVEFERLLERARDSGRGDSRSAA